MGCSPICFYDNLDNKRKLRVSGNVALNMTTTETTVFYAPARNAGRQLKVGAVVVKEQTNRYSRYPSTDVGHSK